MSDVTVQRCEELWEYATRKGNHVRAHDGDREADGNYVLGFKRDSETWTVHDPCFTLRAEKVELSTFRLGEDSTGSWRELSLLIDDNEVFRALEEGGRKVAKFEGDDERFVGNEIIKPQPWKVVSGVLPENLPD